MIPKTFQFAQVQFLSRKLLEKEVCEWLVELLILNMIKCISSREMYVDSVKQPNQKRVITNNAGRFYINVYTDDFNRIP